MWSPQLAGRKRHGVHKVFGRRALRDYRAVRFVGSTFDGVGFFVDLVGFARPFGTAPYLLSSMASHTPNHLSRDHGSSET